MKVVNFKEKKNKCEVCSRAFLSSSDLKIHEKAVHEKIKGYKCEQCEKSFFAKWVFEETHIPKWIWINILDQFMKT